METSVKDQQLVMSVTLANNLLAYLATRPYREVATLIAEVSKCPSVQIQEKNNVQRTPHLTPRSQPTKDVIIPGVAGIVDDAENVAESNQE